MPGQSSRVSPEHGVYGNSEPLCYILYACVCVCVCEGWRGAEGRGLRRFVRPIAGLMLLDDDALLGLLCRDLWRVGRMGEILGVGVVWIAWLEGSITGDSNSSGNYFSFCKLVVFLRTDNWLLGLGFAWFFSYTCKYVFSAAEFEG